MSFRKNRRKDNFSHPPKGKMLRGPTEYRHINQLSEAEVGITQFINPFKGFSGIIKARFSDFHVNEIDLNGDVAKLTNLGVPVEFEKNVDVMEEPSVECPTPLIPQDKWDNLRELWTGKSEVCVELDVNSSSKEERTKIHECIQCQFAGKIYANTITKDEVLFKGNILLVLSTKIN